MFILIAMIVVVITVIAVFVYVCAAMTVCVIVYVWAAMTVDVGYAYTAGGAPQRRRTRHSGVDVMEALDDPDIMLRSDPNLNPKPTPQVNATWGYRSTLAQPKLLPLPLERDAFCATAFAQPVSLLSRSTSGVFGH